MGKIQFPNLRALPAGPRWLAYGVLLLCAILVGGVITAYGGMLLVVLMWAVCMGGLCLLLHFTWQTVFPGQRVAQDKTFLHSWLAGSAVRQLWSKRILRHSCAAGKPVDGGL